MSTAKRSPVLWFIAIVTIGQFWRAWHFVDRYAVDLLTNDDWDDWRPLFGSSSLWQIFRFQHGPRRLGVGLWVTDVVNQISGWNLRTHTFVMLGFLGVSAVLALWLKRRIYGRWQYTDALIPLFFLNLNQWELLLYLPLNGIVMLTLLMALALAFTFERVWPRHAAILFVNFFLIHTGYGMFAVGATGLWLMLLLPRKPKVALVSGTAHLALIALFFYHYVSEPGLAGFKFPADRPWEYFVFMSLMMSRFFGFVKVTGFVWVLALALFLVSLAALARVVRDPLGKKSRVIFLLLVFSLFYQLNAAIGRISLSVYAGTVSRYVTFQIPQMLALYFFALEIVAVRGRRFALGTLIALTVIGTFHLDKRDRATLQQYSEIRAKWRGCFLRTLSFDPCTREAGFAIYPGIMPPHVQREWEYLAARRLHIFQSGLSP